MNIAIPPIVGMPMAPVYHIMSNNLGVSIISDMILSNQI